MYSNQWTIALGPCRDGWGSWEWVGADLMRALSDRFETLSFEGTHIPPCDACVIVKQALPRSVVAEAASRAPVVFCPVDYYESCNHLDDDALMLRRCSRIVVHCERLRRYFASYAPVEYLDHHVKYAAFDSGRSYRSEGFVLWVGVRSNLPFLCQWYRTARPDYELVVLTNLEDPSRVPSAADVGLPSHAPVRIESWTPQRHIELVLLARAALDIKGTDFRQKHKPAAKAIDFLASGLPLAINMDSSAAEHLRSLGFEPADPSDSETWFSRGYFDRVQAFAPLLRRSLSLEAVASRFATIIEDAIKERQSHGKRPSFS